MGSRKLQGNFDIYNILNASTVQNEQAAYSNTNNQWRNAIQIMGGRLSSSAPNSPSSWVAGSW